MFSRRLTNGSGSVNRDGILESVKALISKRRKLLVYLLCSLATAALETGVGWCLIRLFPINIVYANTIAILVGAAAHYLLTLSLVFQMRGSLQSALAYALTFVLGLLFQNAIIWLFYQVVFDNSGLFWQFLISKGLSLALPFFLTYYLRTKINQAIKAKQGETTDAKDHGDASLL